MKTLHTIYSTFAKHNMAKFLTVLALLFTLGVGSMLGATATWEKVTSALADWSGEYLLVYNGQAYNGSLTTGFDNSGNYQTVTDKNGIISLDDKYSVTIATVSEGYSVKTAAGYYIGRSANSNGMDASTTYSANSHKITIAFNSTSKTVKLTSPGSRVLGNNSGRWRFFASSNTYVNITLYKKVTAATCSPLEMSEVTATAGNGEITLGWTNVANANNYEITCSGGTIGNITGTTTKTCTITGLTNGNAYTWSVMPVGDGTIYCEENTPVEGETTPNVFYTVTWMNNAIAHATTQVAGGSKPTFPDTPESCDDTSNSFYGWATASWSGKINDLGGKTIYTSANAMPAVNGNITYYAVFCEGGGSGNGQWVQCESLDDFIDGEYYMFVSPQYDNYYYYVPAVSDVTAAGNFSKAGQSVFGVTDVTSITKEQGGWKLIKSNSNWKIQSSNNANIYLYATATNNGLAANSSSNASSTWSVTKHSTQSTFAFKYNDSRYLCTYNTSPYGFRTYTGTATNGTAYLTVYKLEVASNPINFLTQCTTEATVTLDLDGGSFDSKPDGWEEDGNNYTKTVNSGDQVTLPEPNKTGHDFEGWYNASTKVTSPYTLTGNTTLTAHWTPQTYDITYKDQGDVAFSGTHESGYPTQHTYGTETTLKGATKTGYTFEGWYKEAAYTNKVTTLGANEYTGNITLYAKWTAKALVNYRTDCDVVIKCDAYSFHTGDGTIAIMEKEENITCFVEHGVAQGGLEHEWQIADYIIPDAEKFFVGYYGYFYNDNLGLGDADGDKSRSVVSDWTNMYLAPSMTSDDPEHSPRLGHAKGAKGTLRIFDNSDWDNLYVGFIPDGYTVKFGTNEYPLTVANAANHDYRTEILQYEPTNYANAVSAGVIDAAGKYVATANTQEMRHIFLKVPSNSNWAKDNAKFSIYDIGASAFKNGFMTLVPGSTDLYEGWVDKDCANIIFVRHNATADYPSWDNKWNQTGDLSLQANQNMFTITADTGDGLGDAGWANGTYTKYGKFRMYEDSKAINWYLHFYPYHALTYDKNANDATGTMDMQFIEADAADKHVPLEYCGFTRPGYEFEKWRKGTTSTYYAPNGSNTIELTDDITLYAIWKAKKITITWDANGGTVSPTTSTYTYNGTPVELPTPTRANYIFNGWFTATSGGTKIADVGTTNKPTDDITYYAQWTAKETPTFAWSAASYTAALEADNTFPTLNNPNSLSVTYTSSNTGVATIDANGNITLVATGTTTITANGAESATHQSATDSYELTVVAANCKWIETDIDDIEYGDEVVIAVSGIDANGEAILYMLQDPQATANPKIYQMSVNDLLSTANLNNTLIWNIRKRDDNNDNFTIYKKGSTTDRLAFISSYGVRVGGNNADSIFTLISEKYIKSISSDEYLRMSNASDWRHYSTNTTQSFVFYKKVCLDPTQYWVTWDANGGQLSDGSTKKEEIYTVGATITKPADPTREGYRFDGWTPTPGTMPAENATFTAKWTQMHTITWMVGSTTVWTEEVANGTGVTETPTDDPTDDAIGDCADTFMGWSETLLGSTEGQSAPADLCTAAQMKAKHTSVTGNKTFHAVFATKGSGGIAQGTVLWAENFGHFDTKKPSEAGTGTGTTIYGDASITYSQSSNNTKGYNEEIAGGTKPELLLYKGGNHTWTIAGIPTGGATKMTLSFLSNRTDFNVTSSTTGITVSGSENTWNITANNDVTTFTLTIKNTNSDKNVRIDNVSVVVAEGGVSYSNYVTNCCNTPAPTNGAYTSVSGTEIKLTWDDAANTNYYHITGGNLSAEGVYSNNKYCNITGLTECEEYTFYVSAHPAEGCESAAIQISAQPFSGAKTVTFNPNGGAVSPTSFTTSCDKNSTTLPTPTNSGYRFMGWFTAANGGTEITGTSYTPTADITLFAHWEKEYTVTYDLQGGTASPVCSGDKYIAGEIVTICTSTPVKSGYRFTGWTYSPVVTITNGQFTMPASNVTITAEFVARAVTNIEVATNTHRVLMQGSAFIGEQIRVTYDNGETELLEWNNSKLTFAGHNTNELGVQTVTVTYTGEGTAHTQYDIEVIDGLGITFWDDDYTETIKYEPGDLVDVDNRIGQNICSGWEFVGWSETKVANESNGFTPVHNFNATEPKTLYAVYVQTSTDWISAYNIDELHPGAKYVIVAHYSDGKEFALTNTNNTSSSYLDGANLTTDCEKVREGDAYPYKDRYKLKVTPDENWKWQLENTGSGWTMRNISANKYLKINTDKTISLTTTSDDKFTLSNGNNDSEITAKSNSNNYLSWYNSSKYWNGHISGQQYYLTNETNFTSTPPCSPLSATFHGNGGIVTDGESSLEDLPIKEPTRDAGITTPTASFADCNGKSWTFVGWSREEIDVTRVPVLTTDLLHDGGGNKHYYIQEDGEEFWAVYTNQGNPETKYGTITFTDADVTRQYEDAKTITKSVTAMGDYNFELYHVSKASSLGIQFDHNSTTKGYIKNITSLGKINSISFNDFQTGDIDDVKVYVGNTPNAINTLLTEADLQQTGNTYTYYPQKNYAYVRIEADGYCGITSISIDFGKGTQIWATTPDCSTITLSGDEIYVTATNGRAVMAPTTLTVKANQLEANADVILTSNSSDVYFSTDRTFNFAAGQAANQKPTTSLTLSTDAEGNLATTDVYIHYMPSSEGDGVPADVVISANLETPNPSISDDHTIHVRNLPAKFVIATKVGATWYALPANMTGETNPLAEVIEVDETTMTATAPNTSTYTLWPVKTTNGTGNRYADYGDRLRFAAVNNEQRGLWANNNNNSSAIRNYAVINSLGADGTAAYEWKVTTTVVDGHWQYTLQTDQTQNQNYLRYWTSAQGGAKWGTYIAGNNQLYFLPVTTYTDMDVEVMEWGTNSMVIRVGDVAPANINITINGNTTTKGLENISESDLYKVDIDLTSDDCGTMIIDNGSGARKIIRKPILVSGEKTGSYYTTSLGRDICADRDIVILNGGKLTADELKSTGSHVDFANIYVYPGGKLVLDDNSLGVKQQVYLRGGYSWLNQTTYVLPEVYLNGDINFNGSGNMIYDYYIQNSKYYQFCLPYDVQLGKVTDEAGVDNFPVWVKHYNGDLRAADPYATSWEWYPSQSGDANAYFKAGIGYIIAAKPRQVGNTANRPLSIIRFPLGNTAFNGTAEIDKSVATIAHGIDGYKAGTVTANNVGWNFIGNPFMATWKGDIGHKQLTKYPSEENWDGSYQWVDAATRYITIMSPEDGSDYKQYIAANTELNPFFPFYIQETADGGTGTITFSTANRVKKAPAAIYADKPREAFVQIEIASNDIIDQTGVYVSDKYSDGIDFDDLEKMFGSSTANPKVWIMHENTRLAFESMTEMRAAGTLPLGYRAPQTGVYTLALNEDVSKIDGVEGVYLTDNEAGVIDYDLLLGDYEFESTNILYNDTRFTIRIVMKDNNQGTVTGIDEIHTLDSDKPIKFIYNDKIYILYRSTIYDAAGKRVTTINK